MQGLGFRVLELMHAAVSKSGTKPPQPKTHCSVALRPVADAGTWQVTGRTSVFGLRVFFWRGRGRGGGKVGGPHPKPETSAFWLGTARGLA